MNNRMTIGQLSQSVSNEPIHIQAYRENTDGKCYLLTNILKSYEGIMAQPVMNLCVTNTGMLIAAVDLPEEMIKVLGDV